MSKCTCIEQDGHEQGCLNRPLRPGDYVRWDHFMVSRHVWIEGVLTYISREGGFECPGKRLVRIDVVRSNWFALGSERSVLYGEGITLRRVVGEDWNPSVSFGITTVGGIEIYGSAPVLYDGLTAEQCLDRYQRYQREDLSMLVRKAPNYWDIDLTPTQLAAARELWSAQLRAKRDAAKEKERFAVTYCEVDDDE